MAAQRGRLAVAVAGVCGFTAAVLAFGSLGAESGGAGKVGLRVNATAVSWVVWESKPWALGDPPRCRPLSADGIGRWRCSFRYATKAPLESWAPVPPPAPPGGPPPPVPTPPKDALQTVTVHVNEHGRVRGQGIDGRPVRACCLRVR